MKKILGLAFFDRPVRTVARDLLGKYLVRRVGGRIVSLMIVEVEAYAGPHDLASHARFGRTARNSPMWEHPGTIYVYFTYGMHWMLNLVCDKKDRPAGVLIRGVEGVNGPARLTKFLKIDKKLNGKKLGRHAGVWVEDRGVKIRPGDIKRTPRVGIAYAGTYKSKLWRFVLTAPASAERSR